MEKIWFITGSSRGLGRSLTESVLAKGDKVVATARQPEQLHELSEKYGDQIYLLKLDVTDKEQVTLAVEQAIAHFGRIDVLVNNAGFGITGAAESFTDEQVQSQLDTNLYAPITITRAVLPYMRKQRAGHILQISSVGGRVGSTGLTIYSAAKFGLSGFSEALAKEVGPLGIRVTCVEPGGFRTDWSNASMSFAKEVEGYESTVGWISDFFRGDKYVAVGDPAKAAKIMIDVVNEVNPPLHLVLGSEAAGILRQTEAAKKEEFEKWMPVTISTDHDDAVNFLETEEGKKLAAMKGN